MISACIFFSQTSIAIPQAIVLWRGREQVLPRRYSAIPEPWGKIITAVAVAWVAVVSFILCGTLTEIEAHSHFFQVDVLECFPVIYPVTLVGMNWISVVTVVLLLFTLLLWLMSKRHVFTGPRIDMQKMRLRREEALGIATGGEVMETNNLILRREKV